MIFYKFKEINNHWFIIFEKEGEKVFIYDDAEKLVKFIQDNKNNIFVGGDNYYYDNILISDIICSISRGEFSIKDFPISLDVTQEVIRSSSIKLDTLMLNLDKRVFNYPININLTRTDLEKVLEELIYKVNFIKKLYKEREEYFTWRLNLISEFNLPKSYVTHSKGRLMEDIVSFNGKRIPNIIIDANLKKYIEEIPELQEIYKYLIKGELTEKKLSFGEFEADINPQGLKSGLNNVVDTTGENNFLYIDFNSFGPSIIINNDLLKGISEYPNRYEELKDRRLKLKASKDNTQKYYKRLINSFIDCFSNPDSRGYNPSIYKSITLNGVLIMYLLYLKIKPLGIQVIEVNTDGMIIKTDKINNDEIKAIVNETCERLKMSCDVDPITKIAHKNTAGYCVLFEDGSIKKIGIFGKMENEKMQTNSKRYLSECLLNYYLNNDNNIMRKINELLKANDPTIFQEILGVGAKTGELYLKQDDRYLKITSNSIRLLVVKEESKNPLYKINDEGNFVPYNKKVNYEIVDDITKFDISRLDINYYFDEVKRNIESVSGKKVAMLDIDGTLIEDLDREKILNEVIEILKLKLDKLQTKKLLKMTQRAYLDFINACKKEKEYGTSKNYAIFLKEACQDLLGESFNYQRLASTLLKVEEKQINNGTQVIKTYNGVESGLESLHCQGIHLSIYTNGFKDIQNAKLLRIPMKYKIVHKGDLSNSYAKSCKKGFKDKINKLKLDLNQDTLIMIGNGTSDLPPKTLGIDTYILLNGRDYSKLPKGVITRSEDDVTIASDLEDAAKILERKPIRKRI